mmetsp:Transcript_37993/g.86943  ORF Transcript_37993/g.86943 Transcript_37993/m.86943 type:complete len:92 (+) Transcript_37993:2964-3239(+)
MRSGNDEKYAKHAKGGGICVMRSWPATCQADLVDVNSPFQLPPSRVRLKYAYRKRVQQSYLGSNRRHHAKVGRYRSQLGFVHYLVCVLRSF